MNFFSKAGLIRSWFENKKKGKLHKMTFFIVYPFLLYLYSIFSSSTFNNYFPKKEGFLSTYVIYII